MCVTLVSKKFYDDPAGQMWIYYCVNAPHDPTPGSFELLPCSGHFTIRMTFEPNPRTGGGRSVLCFETPHACKFLGYEAVETAPEPAATEPAAPKDRTETRAHQRKRHSRKHR